MGRTSTPSAPLGSPDYYEKICRLQQGLRDSEKKRLDLENKLYEYNQSDTFRLKLKYVKLKKYLKEIRDSEEKAHTRNQEYLRRCEHFQAHVGHFTMNTDKLQELKNEYETQIKKTQIRSEDSLGIKGEVKDEDREKVIIQARINLGTAMSRGLYQPATIFMGRQMSAVSNIGDFSTEQKPPQPTKNFSIPVPHSCRQTVLSSSVTDSCVVQTNSDTQCLNKPDKINGKTSLQIGEETPVTVSVLSEGDKAHCLEIGSNTRHSKSPLSESKKSAELHSPLLERLSPENRTTDLKCDSSSRSEGSKEEILTQEHIEVKEERAGWPVSRITVSEYCASENHLSYGFPKAQSPYRKTQEEQEAGSLSSSSDLTVSVSEDDLILKSPEPQPNPCGNMKKEDGMKSLISIHSEQDRNTVFTEQNNCILQDLSSPDSEKEPTKSPTRELCDDTDIQKEDDLGACGTAVLNQLQRLQAAGSSREKQVRSEQTTHSDLLGQHITTAKEQDRSLNKEATALLKKALTEECEGRSSIHSNESSCSLPSILNDNGGIKQAKPWLNSVRAREQETNAYQLKQSTIQDNIHQTEDRFQKVDVSTSHLSGLSIGSGTFKTKTTNKIASEENFSSNKGSPLSRHENKRKLPANLKSKAFWGESDDSNSEIEAALCPGNRNKSTDDSDDFNS
ncbi:centrosomal protein kizuna isoform X2 [Echinops telfairi]|uniref:Centrosomal protein kizuna isoform X2 n=1 Tax=Echinops telfairi TaxID=9371 RepID=A0AC55DIB7_ECHTE|nr:centrosomal protein kizuna isoform X2 [Echinops telfairi]